MIIIVKKDHAPEEVDQIVQFLEAKGLGVKEAPGKDYNVLGIVGDTSAVSIDQMRTFPCVLDVKRVSEPFKKANRKFHPQDTIITLDNGLQIGEGHFVRMAGPCSVESEEQFMTIARGVAKSGAQVLRGGAFKPRTSPYSFQGLGEEGIKIMLKAKKETGLPIVTEIMDASQLKYFDEVDIIQVGARNMQNFELLKVLGKTDKPILLKRGLSATMEEWLMSAEYVMSEGNDRVILCERGIRTFETATRNTLDLSSVPVIKKKSHLPIIVDPSHGVGHTAYVPAMAYAAAACGADGLIVEVHNDPKNALSDGQQSLTLEQYDAMIKKVNRILEVVKE